MTPVSSSYLVEDEENWFLQYLAFLETSYDDQDSIAVT